MSFPHRSRRRLHPRTPNRRVVVFGLVVGLAFGAGPVDAARKVTTSTSGGPFTGKAGAAQVASAVTASALPFATQLGATLGKPSCPPVEKPKVGLTLQCVIAFGKNPVGWLVTLGEGSSLLARPTFPVVSKRVAELAAGGGAVCSLAPFAGLPVGATVSCTSGKQSIELVVQSDGTLRRR